MRMARHHMRRIVGIVCLSIIVVGVFALMALAVRELGMVVLWSTLSVVGIIALIVGAAWGLDG